jgi:hypothetical protein
LRRGRLTTACFRRLRFGFLATDTKGLLHVH